MAKERTNLLDSLEEATAAGRIGDKPHDVPNSAFTLAGQGPETAALERSTRWTQRQAQYDGSGETADTPSKSSGTKSSGSSSKS